MSVSSLTSHAMRRDIERQPMVLAAVQARVGSFMEMGAQVLQPGSGGRLYVTGCGDGLFAAMAVQGFAERLGIDWRPMGALDMVLSAGGFKPADRVLAISMSGNVDRTVEAAIAVKSAGVPLAVLVNTPQGGRLGQVAMARISLELDDVAPFLCGTASYTATILALMAIASGAAAAGTPPDAASVMETQRVAMTRADAVLPLLGLPSGVRLLSAGAERGTVAYGAAKLVELTNIPAWSCDLEEFAHSQYWSMPLTDLVVVVATQCALAKYADDACAALRELGVATLAVDTLESPVPNASRRITLPLPDPTLAPLVTAVPLQLLAASMARLSGLDPDTRAHLKADETRFRVSRLLTRRSLVGTGS